MRKIACFVDKGKVNINKIVLKINEFYMAICTLHNMQGHCNQNQFKVKYTNEY